MQTVSVITVVYNAINEIQETIDSVSVQDYENIEYIIVDGGSTDGTFDLIKNNHGLIDKFISEKDKGIYDAMNKGVSLASGSFVIFMNAGDKFFSNDVISKIFEHQVESDVLYGDCWVVGSRSNDGLNFAKPTNMLPYGMICSHQSMFFRRNILLENPFSLDFGIAGDYECICRLFNNGAKFLRLENIIVSYYLAGGVSDLRRRQVINNTYKASLIHFDFSLSLYFYFLKKYLRAWVVDTYTLFYEKR